MIKTAKILAAGTLAALGTLGLSGCATNKVADCSGPQTRNLDAAFGVVEQRLANGCDYYFESYMANLLEIAEGDPQPQNKRKFSEFLVAMGNRGLLSNRQAQEVYNRYFNVKFVALQGDYNNCAHTCPRVDQVMNEMQNELAHKELGLLRISQDADGYYRADRLFKETELVLGATCLACSAGQ